jgi:predicted phosphohydrolase
MNIWAIADLHLSFGTPNKKMDLFGEKWRDHAKKIEENWREVIDPQDLVLIAGDISWAMNLEEAIADLNWIAALPGTKVMIKGNHDYWWQTVSKIRKALPPSCHIIQNDAFQFQDVSICGSRLWDTSEYGFQSYIDFTKPQEQKEENLSESEKIFERELGRLEMSLKCLKTDAKLKIAMTHYPPISASLEPSKASHLFEKYGVDIVVFGHLHNVKEGSQLFGKKGNTLYALTACDYLNFKPLKLM